VCASSRKRRADSSFKHYSPGETVLVKMSFCKYRNIPATVDTSLTDSDVKPFPEQVKSIAEIRSDPRHGLLFRPAAHVRRELFPVFFLLQTNQFLTRILFSKPPILSAGNNVLPQYKARSNGTPDRVPFSSCLCKRRAFPGQFPFRYPLSSVSLTRCSNDSKR
jgi:hypothetical protein